MILTLSFLEDIWIYTDEEKLSQHCMEGLDDKFNEKCKKGDFIVAGKTLDADLPENMLQ